jgi:hypothetical protein
MALSCGVAHPTKIITPNKPQRFRDRIMLKAYSQMARLRTLFLQCLAVTCCMASPARASESEALVALRWAEMIDAHEIDQTWAEASSLFKQSVSKDQWRSLIPNVRTPLGAVVSRSLKSSEARTTLPGAPDGDYRILQFDTRFAQKQAAVETVVLQLESSRGWRVSGYFIR